MEEASRRNCELIDIELSRTIFIEQGRCNVSTSLSSGLEDRPKGLRKLHKSREQTKRASKARALRTRKSMKSLSRMPATMARAERCVAV